MPHNAFNKKILLTVLIPLVVIGGLAAFLTPKLRIILPLRMKYSMESSPGVYLIPQKRQIQVAGNKEGRYRYSAGSLYFNVPRRVARSFRSEHAWAFVFDGNRTLIVSSKSERQGVLKALLGGNPAEAEEMLRFMGEENLASEYSAVAFCLNSTPAKAGVFTPQKELLRIPPMLILKSAYGALGKTIYQFETDHFRGFQFGDPAAADAVYVYLYDASDRLHRIKCSGLSQEEIDLILAAIRFGPLNAPS